MSDDDDEVVIFNGATDDCDDCIALICDRSVYAPALAKRTRRGKWAIFVLGRDPSNMKLKDDDCVYFGYSDDDWGKKILNDEFDAIIPFNDYGGVSYAAVEKGGLWGLVRLRTNPETAEYPADDPIDKNALYMQACMEGVEFDHSCEIKLIEAIKEPDLNKLKEKYHLGDRDGTMSMKHETDEEFNHIEWLRDFEEATQRKDGFRELRAQIFQDTVKYVTNGSYKVSGFTAKIDNSLLVSEYFTKPPKLEAESGDKTHFAVINADCLETSKVLSDAGLNPCVLNLASRRNPGGGVLGGAGAQEENLFRRTNLFYSLYQYASYAGEYGIERSKDSYPLNSHTGGIYTGHVTVFRGAEKNGYCLLRKPYTTSIVTVPAINRPDLEKRDGEYFLVGSCVEPTKEKIRTILRISGKYKHDCLVLGAFGCGAFANPPNHIAVLFKKVFEEDEFKNKFKTVVFAIYEDHNSRKAHNPNGNVLPFLEVFDE
jgi:uncharacterized protein (TIGR02452 family)